MNFFGNGGNILSGSPRSSFGSGLFDDGPSIVEKVEMLFTDVETEGKKQGYDRAAQEYKKVYQAIESEFLQTKKLIEEKKNSCDNRAEALIRKLEDLEKEKAELEKQVNKKVREVSRRFDIPVSDVKNSLSLGTLLIGGSAGSADVLGVIYKHKERKLKDAEQKGYVEAKTLYENKISKLKTEIKRLRKNGDRDIQELLSLVDEVLVAIANEQMKIAELRILL